tara:strand:+ start:13483 stop:13977 length:495 start_codon:yes stop_codon:yes gene_type:complete
MTKESKANAPLEKEAGLEGPENASKAAKPKAKIDANPAKEIESEKKLSAYQIIEEFEKSQQKEKLPQIYVGDTVKVGVRISEGNKQRVQPYEGVIIAKRHGGLNQTITVRRIFQGIGVERVFMVHSPQVASIKVERRGKVRRAKLFYLRDRVGKATRVKQRFDR